MHEIFDKENALSAYNSSEHFHNLLFLKLVRGDPGLTLYIEAILRLIFKRLSKCQR